MYANKDVAEPTRGGNWWRRSCYREFTIERVKITDGRARWANGPCWRDCRVEDVTWTGPIPVPEDMIDRMFKGNPPPEDEDEGEEWGRALRAARPIRQKFPYDDMHSESKKEWNDAGLRFRAKCVAPYLKVVKAAKRVDEWELSSDQVSQEFIGDCATLHSAILDLPDQGELAEDNPSMSDEELGRVAWAATIGFLSAETEGEPEFNKREAYAFVGGAIRRSFGAAIRAELESK